MDLDFTMDSSNEKKGIWYVTLDLNNKKESLWQFSYKRKEGTSLYDQYEKEFRNRLRDEGFFTTENNILSTGRYKQIYLSDINNMVLPKEGYKELCSGRFRMSTDKFFNNVYSYRGSFIVEEGEYTGIKHENHVPLDEGENLRMRISIVTPEKFSSVEEYFSKKKHNGLEKKLNRIIRR